MDSMFLLYEVGKKSVGLEDMSTMRPGLSCFYPDLNEFRMACYKNLPTFKKDYEAAKVLEERLVKLSKDLAETVDEVMSELTEGKIRVGWGQRQDGVKT